MQYAVSSLQCVLCSVHCEVCSVQYAVYSLKYVVCRVQGEVCVFRMQKKIPEQPCIQCTLCIVQEQYVLSVLVNKTIVSKWQLANVPLSLEN